MTIKSLALILVGVLGLVQTASARPLDEIKSSGYIKFAVYRDFEPFSAGDHETLHGLDAELGKLIATRLGLRAEYLPIYAGESVSDDLRNAVWKGHYIGHDVADIMLHVPVDKELALRNDNAYIFAPYFTEQIVVAVDPQQTSSGDLVAAFGEHKVGVEGDTLADHYLLGAFGGQLRENVTHFHNMEQAVAAMAHGKIAGVMGTRSEIEAALKKYGKHFKVTTVPTPGLTARSWPIGMAVKVNSHDLANAVEPLIESMQRDGRLAKLFAKYGLTYVPPSQD